MRNMYQSPLGRVSQREGAYKILTRLSEREGKYADSAASAKVRAAAAAAPPASRCSDHARSAAPTSAPGSPLATNFRPRACASPLSRRRPTH